MKITAKNDEIVRLENISKAFPGVQALSGVSFSVRAGECHALVGENGAGKSTLIKIMMGAYTKDDGRILVNGTEVSITGPTHAKKLGLGAVYQDINLAQHLSVGENFFQGKMPLTKLGLVDWKAIYSKAEETLLSLGVTADVRAKVRSLSTAQQEMVAIAKTVHENATVIVFDEPTALLTNDETKTLFDLIRRLKADGIGIVYISHRMEEIFEVCDRVTVLKDGALVDTLAVSDTDEERLVQLMVGRDVDDLYSIAPANPGDTVCEVKSLCAKGRFSDISFSVRRGEILGLFGLVGSGRTEIMRCLFGADRLDSGTVEMHGKPVHIHTPKQGISNRIAFLPEDRKHQGLALQLPVRDNINLASYRMVSRAGVISSRREMETAEHYIHEINIKTPTPMQKVQNLSGGNQQKVVISKWLCRDSDLFIFDEPTVGVDVGAKMEIYRLFEELLAQGKAIIVISSYLPEVMGLAHRLMVIYEGRQMGVIDREDFHTPDGRLDEERVLRLASGLQAM